MIFAFLGYTGSGKDTIVKRISKELDIPIVVSHTTRPMRSGETQDVEYHFVDNKYFVDNKNKFVEIREYQVYNGDTWYYGFSEEEFRHENALLIIDPQGLDILRDRFGRDVKAFYIDSPEEQLRERLKVRGDNEEEINRRLKDDYHRFHYFRNNGDYLYIKNDSDLDIAVNKVKRFIEILRSDNK